jgi:hypothetical protein
MGMGAACPYIKATMQQYDQPQSHLEFMLCVCFIFEMAQANRVTKIPQTTTPVYNIFFSTK